MNNHFTYFLILAASVAGPLALSFDKKVAFYRKWKFVFLAMIVPAVLYIIWDMLFTRLGVWSFNPLYVTGWRIGNLPVEEVLFFFIVPYCCLFVYECVRCYFPTIRNFRLANWILQFLGWILFFSAIFYHRKYYTFSAFFLLSLAILLMYALRNFFRSFDAMTFLISFLIILVPFLIVNGFLTAIPVVLYNNSENLGLRIFSIPLEDIFYGMLLAMMNVCMYERFRNPAMQSRSQ